MPLKRIWTGLDAWVEVYHLDANGNRITLSGAPWVLADGPLLSYCYFQNTSLSASMPATRRPATGRPQKRIVNLTHEAELDVEHFYLSKNSECSLDQIFHREKWLELVLRLEAREDATQLDLHTLRFAKRTDFRLGVPENSQVTGSAKFIAEQVL